MPGLTDAHSNDRVGVGGVELGRLRALLWTGRCRAKQPVLVHPPLASTDLVRSDGAHSRCVTHSASRA